MNNSPSIFTFIPSRILHPPTHNKPYPTTQCEVPPFASQNRRYDRDKFSPTSPGLVRPMLLQAWIQYQRARMSSKPHLHTSRTTHPGTLGSKEKRGFLVG